MTNMSTVFSRACGLFVVLGGWDRRVRIALGAERATVVRLDVSSGLRRSRRELRMRRLRMLVGLV